MRPATFVRPLAEEEKRQLETGLRSRDAFTLRRSQILLASAGGRKPSLIASYLGCTPATVCNAIRAFERDGLNSLNAKSGAPKQPFAVWPKERDDDLRALLHQNPRSFRKPRSTWTLDLIAEVCFERGMTGRRLTGEAVRCILRRLEINWKRAKHWMTSPDPEYAAKKARRDRLIRQAARHPDWVLVFEDEVWWSRLSRPTLNAWTEGPPLKVQLLKPEEDDPDPEAVACYGMLRHDTHRVQVRFVEGRPLADVTNQFLDWACWRVTGEGKRALIVVWDDASWHTADAVSAWVKDHNRRARRQGGVKLVICELPVASPWLNNIEPCWKHAKKAILDLDRKLTAQETVSRVCEHFGCELLPYLQSEVRPDEEQPMPLASDSSASA
jgi:transposase